MDTEVDQEQPKHQLWRRWQLVIAAVGLLLLTISLGLAEAQQNNRAGLVMQYGDGSVATYCIDLAQADTNGDGVTMGDEVLRAANLPVAVEVSALGPAVCKVGNEGCNYPADDCFCECTLAPGSNCRYWAYNRLQGNQWVFSGRGAGSTVVRPGDVEGWVWGFGTINAGAQPAVRTFNDICVQQAQAPSATPSRTQTRSPTAQTPSATPGTLFMPQLMHDLPTLTPGPSPSATATASITRTPSPTTEGASAPVAATSTPAAPTNTAPVQASDTPQVTATDGTPAQQQAPSLTPVIETAVPSETAASTLPSSTEEAVASPVEVPASESAPQAGTSIAQPYPAAEVVSSPVGTATSTSSAVAKPDAQAPASTRVVLAPVQPAGSIPPTPTVAGTARGSSSYGQYAVFMILVGLLAAGWFVARRQRGGE